MLLVSLIGLLGNSSLGCEKRAGSGEFRPHGGYTLLLGNNPVFYEAVAEAALGDHLGDYARRSSPSGQPVWLRGVNASLELQDLPDPEFSGGSGHNIGSWPGNLQR
ncbi:MAG: hypothetical protein R3C12_11870 [Planctomycetaceae bacterium]